MYYYVAPMQGHTDAPYRHIHAKIYGEADAYFTPFLRIERNDFRQRDVRDLRSELNENQFLIPQIIFNSIDEFDRLCELVIESGYREIDLNMGCPYPMQTHHGRGAAVIADRELTESVCRRIAEMEDVSFSIKMRPGLKDRDEWKGIIDLINGVNLAHVTFHPRLATQKYDGEIDYEAFGEFLEACRHPVIFNGDVRTPEDIAGLTSRFEDMAGIMAGRGLLARPSLMAEAREGDWGKGRRMEAMMRFHDELREHYASRLCGDAQLLAKLKAFWEYAEDEIGRKAWKAIRKSVNMRKYDAALDLIR